MLAAGDSIVNDTMRSGCVAKLQEAYPKAKFREAVCVRGGGGYQHYREDGRIARNVVPRQTLAGLHRPFQRLSGNGDWLRATNPRTRQKYALVRCLSPFLNHRSAQQACCVPAHGLRRSLQPLPVGGPPARKRVVPKRSPI